MLATLRVPRPVAEGEEFSGPSILVSPVQTGVVRFMLRVARLRAGLPVEGVSHQMASGSVSHTPVVYYRRSVLSNPRETKGTIRGNTVP